MTFHRSSPTPLRDQNLYLIEQARREEGGTKAHTSIVMRLKEKAQHVQGLYHSYKNIYNYNRLLSFLIRQANSSEKYSSKLMGICLEYLIKKIIKFFNFLMVTFQTDPIIFAAAGGIILGLATSLNYIVRGKVTGMSGIVYGIISLDKGQLPEKLSIVGGMFLISGLFFLLFGYGYYSGFEPFGPESEIAYWTTFPGFALSGFLVGFGTKLGNGCTSGHGLCGIPRLSLRSVVAVCTFLFTAIGISTLSYYVGLGPFINDPSLSPEINYDHEAGAIVMMVIGLGLPVIGFVIAKNNTTGFESSEQIKDQGVVFFVGILFAIGLMISGMTRRENILQFLQINSEWNPALMFVLGCGLLVNMFTFTCMRKREYSLFGNKVFDPRNNAIDLQLVGGAFCFGLGWGIGGLCPGPFLCLWAVFTVPIQVIWGISLVVGQLLANQLSEYLKRRREEKEIEKSENPLMTPTSV